VNEQKIYNTVVNTVKAADDGSSQITNVVIPAGAIANSTAIVTMTNNPTIVPPPPADAQGCGVAAKISLSNGQGLLSGGKTAAVTLSFADNNNDGFVDGTSVRTDSLEIYSASASTGPWKKDFSSSVDLSARTVTGYTPHFSFFSLFAPLSADLSSVEIYPVPFIPKDGNPDTGAAYSLGDQNSGIIFDKLPGSVHIKIYTVTGQLVAHFGSDSSSGKLQWNVKNDDGHDVASGGYIAVISSPGHKDAVKKILVVR
jgi:hypothetical protein